MTDAPTSPRALRMLNEGAGQVEGIVTASALDKSGADVNPPSELIYRHNTKSKLEFDQFFFVWNLRKGLMILRTRECWI